MRRGGKESLAANGRDSPALRGLNAHRYIEYITDMEASATPDLRLDEKIASTASPSDNEPNTPFTVQVSIPPSPSSCLQLICKNQMVHYLARNAIPRLRRFLVDADKILAASQNVVYYIINPAMKGKTK